MWLTVKETLAPFFGASTTGLVQIPLHMAETTLHNLLCWAEGLPDDCARSVNTPHHVLTLQYVTSKSRRLFVTNC